MLGTLPNAATSFRARSMISRSRSLRPAVGSEMVSVTCSASLNETGSRGRKTPFSYTASTFCCKTDLFYRRSGGAARCSYRDSVRPTGTQVVRAVALAPRWHASMTIAANLRWGPRVSTACFIWRPSEAISALKLSDSFPVIEKTNFDTAITRCSTVVINELPSVKKIHLCVEG